MPASTVVTKATTDESQPEMSPVPTRFVVTVATVRLAFLCVKRMSTRGEWSSVWTDA